MNKYVYRLLCKNYERSALAMLAEMQRYRIRDERLDTNDAAIRYQEDLRLLRIFLDNEGIHMPKPKWRYDEKNQDTWLFTPQKSLNKSFHMLQSRRG